MAEPPSHPPSREETLTAHEARSVEELVRLHREHQAGAGRLQRTIDAATAFLSRPVFAAALVAIIVAWVAITALAGAAADSPAFVWLEMGATLTALVISVMILVTQRREDALAERRAQLTLEMALLADRRSAKIIALLEELRRDTPNIADRTDTESDEMARPADPKAVLAAIEAEHEARD